MSFRLHVQEPFLNHIQMGLKCIEGRLGKPKYRSLVPDQLLCFNDVCSVHLTAVHAYTSFRALLEAESLETVLPGVKTVSEGVDVYYRFYTAEEERQWGVVALHFTLLKKF